MIRDGQDLLGLPHRRPLPRISSRASFAGTSSAQREACEAYIKSQEQEGWRLVPDRYNDGGLSVASLDCPDLQQLLADVRAGNITIVVVTNERVR